jgi:hypothetical protein
MKFWSCRPFFVYHTAFSTLILGCVTCAVLGIPLGRVAPYLFTAVVVLFCVLLWRDFRVRPFSKKATATVLMASGLFLSAVIVLWGCLFGGEFTSAYPDPWAYSATANYLLEPVADPESIVNRFGKALTGTRLGTPGLLAIFARLSGTDTCRASYIWALFTLFHIGLGTAVMSWVLGASRLFSFFSGVFIIAVGWAPEVIKIGNWDQILFVGLVPFLVAKLKLIRFESASRTRVVSLGLTLAAAFCTYPEGAAIAAALFLPMVVLAIFRGSNPWKKLARYVGGVVFCIILAAVYLPTGIAFLRSQFETGNTTLVAKGGFWGLLSWQWPVAFFGLGDELTAVPFVWYRFLVPGALILLSLYGALRWFRSREFAWLSIVSFLGLAAWQAGLVRYDYGFYKVLTIFWPVVVAMIAVGASWLCRATSRWRKGLLTGAFLIVCIATVIDEAAYFKYKPWRQKRHLGDFVNLYQIGKFCGQRPIRISTRDWFVQMWAVFFLRDQKLIVPNPLLYLQNSGLLSTGPATDPMQDAWVLLDAPRKDGTWKDGQLTLLEHPDPVELMSVEGPNQLFRWLGDPFVWLNDETEKFTVLAQYDMTARLVVPDVWIGAQRPENVVHTLILRLGEKTSEIPVQKQVSLDLPLHRGINCIELRCKKPDTMTLLPPGDERKLMVGFKGFRIEAE